MASLSIEISHFIKAMAVMGLDPGELQRGRMGPKAEEQMLVESQDADGRRSSSATEPGEIWPAIVLQGEQPSVDKFEGEF